MMRLALLLALAAPLPAPEPHHYVFFGMDRDALVADTAFLNNATFDGAQVAYSWRQLEPAEGEYDFSIIRSDLALLKAHHKRLFVQLQDVTFSYDHWPVPRYLLNEARFHGGVDKQKAGWITRRYDPAVQERLHRLYDELGKAFDGEIEGMNMAETAADYDKPEEYPQGFTPEHYRDAMVANMAALKQAFPRSVVVVYGNFMPGERRPDEDKGYLRAVYDAALAQHIGVGGPDVLPKRPGQLKSSYPLIHDIADKVPVGMAVQDGNYDESTMPELLDFATNYLGATYIFWCTQQPYYSKLAAFLKQSRQSADHNPAFPGWYADPEAHVFAKQYWIYPTYSAPYDQQTFLDAFSSNDLVTWQKHAHVLDSKAVKWAKRAVWAPSIIEKNGWYYLFFGANDIQNDNQVGGIGIARARTPDGPFVDYLGKPLIGKFHNGAQPIDQNVFRDKAGAYYIVYGGWGHCNIARLKNDFTGIVPLPDGTLYKEITPKGYVEGAYMLQKDGRYYFMWSEGGWGTPDYAVAYAVGNSPFGPFERVGKILQQDSAVATSAGHHSVLHAPASDKWYIVYHRRPLGETDRNHRVVSIDEMKFDAHGMILPVKITKQGVAADPITRDPLEPVRLSGPPTTAKEQKLPLVYWSEIRMAADTEAVHVLRVDLKDRHIAVDAVAADDPDGGGPAEAALTNPLQLANRADILAAVNANAFAGLPDSTGKRDSNWHETQRVQIAGIAVQSGVLRSEGRDSAAPDQVFAIDAKGHGYIGPAPSSTSLRAAVNAWSFKMLEDGKTLPKPGGARNPRTAVGLDKTGRWLYIVVVDGRQPGKLGMSPRELADQMMKLGAGRAVNLDGGGSSIMLVRNNGALVTVNMPSGRSPRPIPVMLVVRRVRQ